MSKSKKNKSKKKNRAKEKEKTKKEVNDVGKNQSNENEENSSRLEEVTEENHEGDVIIDNDMSMKMNNESTSFDKLETYHENHHLSLKMDPAELFNLIHSGQTVPTLPTQSWAIHCTDAPVRCIVISEMTITHESGVGLVPLYIKQIVFDEKMNYELFLLNSKAGEKNKPCDVESITDVMNVIAYTNNLKLCIGGPAVSMYCNVNPECAYKDPKGSWRHNLCSLEVNEDDTCESCVSLEEILRRHVQRNKQNIIKRKRI